MPKKNDTPLIRPAKPVKDWTNEETADFVLNSFQRFGGMLDTWENAVGMLYLGKFMGWKIVHLVHSQRTVKKYEEILGISVRTDFDPTTEASGRSYAWQAIQGFSNFWKAVKGETDIENARSKRVDALTS